MHFKLKITLKHIKPAIWRTFMVRGDVSFIELHEAIQIIMGWQNYHLFEFNIGDVVICHPNEECLDERDTIDADEALLQDYITKKTKKFEYYYDFGDNWKHEVKVEEIFEPMKHIEFPICSNGARACPPEDCGGVHGYEELCEAVKKPRSKAAREFAEWLGYKYDPVFFDQKAVNQDLEDFFAPKNIYYTGMTKKEAKKAEKARCYLCKREKDSISIAVINNEQKEKELVIHPIEVRGRNNITFPLCEECFCLMVGINQMVNNG